MSQVDSELLIYLGDSVLDLFWCFAFLGGVNSVLEVENSLGN